VDLNHQPPLISIAVVGFILSGSGSLKRTSTGFSLVKRMAENERTVDIAILDSYHREYES
jgi:hypothetical protein